MSRFNHLNKAQTPSRISLGTINRITLDKPVGNLSQNEHEQLSYLKKQLRWSKQNGYRIVLTDNSYRQNGIDCWMLKNSSMPYLAPGFRKKILHIL